MAFSQNQGGIRSRSANQTPDGSNVKLMKQMSKK